MVGDSQDQLTAHLLVLRYKVLLFISSQGLCYGRGWLILLQISAFGCLALNPSIQDAFTSKMFAYDPSPTLS